MSTYPRWVARTVQFAAWVWVLIVVGYVLRSLFAALRLLFAA